ncbi:hypothetical protein, partial [Pseudomonas aeruginosa]|uniref:hypothetical protein n=1 Tax=Pseudomonas aeruginosa TaxID=287 RepID=UPI0031B76808
QLMSIDQEDILGQKNEFEEEDTPAAEKKKGNKNGQLLTYGAYAVALIVVGFAMFKIFGPRFMHSDNQGYGAAPITIDQPVGQVAGQYGYQGQGYQPQPQPTAPAAANQYQQAPNYPSEPQLPATAAAPVPEVVLQPVSAVSPTAQLQQQAAVAPQAEAVAPVAK